jgi:hypothetical protein
MACFLGKLALSSDSLLGQSGRVVALCVRVKYVVLKDVKTTPFRRSFYEENEHLRCCSAAGRVVERSLQNSEGANDSFTAQSSASDASAADLNASRTINQRPSEQLTRPDGFVPLPLRRWP